MKLKIEIELVDIDNTVDIDSGARERIKLARTDIAVTRDEVVCKDGEEIQKVIRESMENLGHAWNIIHAFRRLWEEYQCSAGIKTPVYLRACSGINAERLRQKSIRSSGQPSPARRCETDSKEPCTSTSDSNSL